MLLWTGVPALYSSVKQVEYASVLTPPPPAQGCNRREGVPELAPGAVTRAVGGGYCRLQMPVNRAPAARDTVAGQRLGALEGLGARGGGGGLAPFQCIPAHHQMQQLASSRVLACLWALIVIPWRASGPEVAGGCRRLAEGLLEVRRSALGVRWRLVAVGWDGVRRLGNVMVDPNSREQPVIMPCYI